MRQLLLILIIALSLPIAASAEEIDKFISEIKINADSSIEVTEKILYDFGNLDKHGIIRNIPMRYGSGIDEVKLELKINSVTDENGRPYLYENTGYYYTLLKIGDPNKTITGKHWYYINYTFDKAINGFDNHDELYWNVTGNGWSVPINYAEAKITLPAPSKNNQATCYTGAVRDKYQYCSAEAVSKTTFIFKTDHYGLSPYEGLTIVAGFDKNIVTLPSILKIDTIPYGSLIYLDQDFTNEYAPQSFRLDPGKYKIKIDKFKYRPYKTTIELKQGEAKTIKVKLKKSILGIFLDIILPIIFVLFFSSALFLMWWFKGRDPKGRGSIYPIYEPPEKLTPGEIGVIINKKIHPRDISATIINFAVKGYLKIKKLDQKNYQFIKLKELPNNSQIQSFERRIWQTIFNKKDVCELSSLKNNFYLQLKKIKNDLYDLVISKNYFKNNPRKAKIKYIVLGIITSALLITGGIVLWILIDSKLYIIFSSITAIEAIVFFFLMPKVTKKGALIKEKILGFKMYLKHAERYRLERLYSPKNYKNLFEKYLPYAITLKVEKEWAKQFEDIYKTPPSWYEGESFTVFNTIALVSSLNSFNHTSSGIFTSHPNNSSYSGWSGGSSSWSGGSGFSGGGYSGGGFGGGGGSSW